MAKQTKTQMVQIIEKAKFELWAVTELPNDVVGGIEYHRVEFMMNGFKYSSSFRVDDGKFVGSFLWFPDGGGCPGPMKFRGMMSVFELPKQYGLVPEVDGDQPVIGVGGYIAMYSDREPVTIVDVINDKTIVVRMDKATLNPEWKMEVVVGGFAGHVINNGGEWIIEQNPDGKTEVFTLRENGCWVRRGESAKSGTRVILGKRLKFYDYNF